MIIPARNEAKALPRLLKDLHQQRHIALAITVVDGGSHDDTLNIAASFGAQCFKSPAGRGQQLNVGWRASDDALLLFLHADSRLPDSLMLANAMQALVSHDLVRTAGHFPLAFVDRAPGHERFYRHLESKSALNRPQTFNGDQGLLISRAFMERIGGFDESLPFLEDQAIGAAIYRLGQLITLPGTLQTSARRFEAEGHAARYVAMLLIMCAREAGCSNFLASAPALYREQTQTHGLLKLYPLVNALADEVDGNPAFWLVMARYARENAWQVAQALDSILDGKPRCLPAFERFIEPNLPDNSIALRALATAMRLSLRPGLPLLARIIDKT